MVCLKIKEIKSHLLANKFEDEGDKLKFLAADETWLINKEVQDGFSYHTQVAFENKQVIFWGCQIWTHGFVWQVTNGHKHIDLKLVPVETSFWEGTASYL